MAMCSLLVYCVLDGFSGSTTAVCLFRIGLLYDVCRALLRCRSGGWQVSNVFCICNVNHAHSICIGCMSDAHAMHCSVLVEL